MAVKEEDGSSNLLFSKIDEKEKTKEHKCGRCGHENSSQGRPGRGQDKNWKPWKKKDGDQGLSQIRCYKCKELGHYKGECPKMETEANLIHQIPGVVMDCPKNIDKTELDQMGSITSSVIECISPTMLNLKGKQFQGIIPSSLSSLGGLEVLDISQNNLSGKIPQFLRKWNSLEFLNLSFNDFEGEVPTVSVCQCKCIFGFGEQ
ncbi:protein kinase-like domain-containing protein [Artemisia annua]|uniref:Protein kinase-like domain-containing protein n=1 Tax=Artemisia annua TaxID=35608 RepID=A0A2U1NNP7_ARTAN|nr:protein kinase-like domain-containing protein [Artemisia annua]